MRSTLSYISRYALLQYTFRSVFVSLERSPQTNLIGWGVVKGTRTVVVLHFMYVGRYLLLGILHGMNTRRSDRFIFDPNL